MIVNYLHKRLLFFVFTVLILAVTISCSANSNMTDGDKHLSNANEDIAFETTPDIASESDIESEKNPTKIEEDSGSNDLTSPEQESYYEKTPSIESSTVTGAYETDLPTDNPETPETINEYSVSPPAKKADVELLVFLDRDVEDNIDTIDMGNVPDGIKGREVAFYIKNKNNMDVDVQFDLGGKDADLFEIDGIKDNISQGEKIALSVVYNGEKDPGSADEKTAFLSAEIGGKRKHLYFSAVPTVNDTWALCFLVGKGIDEKAIKDALAVFSTRDYPRAYLAMGILKTHLFALENGNDTIETAVKAYDYLVLASEENKIKDDVLNITYRGVAQAFLAQKRGVMGDSNLNKMESYFQSTDNDAANWYPLFWKGVTYLRVSQGIRDTFGRTFYSWINPYRDNVVDLWEPEGVDALSRVRDAYENSMIPKGKMDVFTYNSLVMPVPEEIRMDALSTGNDAFKWD